ncbi:ATP synthase subunit delta [Marivirga lumbricoides]|uniref:ATP synthase subunit delta n=1 Tax=Marivirga lumbricoides TaxID=1046115 RepID=A0A2T4DJH6_9BACT|nr:ATP synthase F1 subunit delta [Marivirga lumbricoides]GGC51004.1 ATP synthase subunit delta [Marivirga lumbricoides]
MSEFRIASRYAKSLLDLSVERNTLDETKNDMDLFLKVSEQNRDFVLLLKNPIVKSAKKSAIIKEIFSGKVSDLSLAFFDIIAKKGRESYLLDITQAFQTLYNKYKGIMKAEVTTTFPLTDNLRDEVKRLVNEITGKTIDLKENIDKSIIGGFLLKVGDRQIDDTVSAKLSALRRELTKNQYIKQI